MKKTYIYQIGILIIVIFFCMLLDGFSIFTLFWKSYDGTIIEVKTIKYPKNTQFGTVSSYITDAKIVYNINGIEFLKIIRMNKKLIEGENIKIRINADNTKVSVKDINYILYCVLLFIVLLYLFFSFSLKD